MSSYPLLTANRQLPDRCPGFITDLILRCADGEEAALGSLFDHLYPMVASIVGGASVAGTSDGLVAAIFRRVWDRSPEYDPKVSSSVDWVVSQVDAALAGFVSASPEGPAVLTR